MAAGRAGLQDWSAPALVAAQAISTFNHSLLRSATLTLVSFRGLSALGMTTEAVIALSTLVIVMPYVLLSLLGGRLADKLSRSTIVRTMIGIDVPIMILGVLGLAAGQVILLVTVLLLAGVQAALLGPAKYAILPDLVAPDRLVWINGWISAAGTVAVTLGLTLGSLVALSDGGLWILIAALPMLSALGAGITLCIRGVDARAPALPLCFVAVLSDARAAVARLRDAREIAWPLIGSCWFWFQGTLLTALLPLYVAKTGQAEAATSVFFLMTTLGVAAGALAASRLITRFSPKVLVLAVVPVIVLPMLDFAIAPSSVDFSGLVRLSVDLAVTSAGAGFYLVPLTAAIQRWTPKAERARFVGISHTLSGSAMCLGGVVIFIYPLIGLSISAMFLLMSVATAVLAALSLWHTLAGNKPAALSV